MIRFLRKNKLTFLEYGPFLGLFLLMACSTTKPIPISTTDIKIPDWAKSVPKSKEYKYYIGRAYNVNLEEEGVELATQDVYYQIIRENFGVKTKIHKRLTETLQQADYNKKLEEISHDIQFSGIERENVFFSKKGLMEKQCLDSLKISKEVISQAKRRQKERLHKNKQWQAFLEGVENNNIRQVESSLKHGVPINGKGPHGNTALHIASKNGNLHLVELLISHGINLNIKNDEGDIAAHLAMSNNYNSIVKTLILKGSNVETPNSNGRTPFNWAVEKGYEDIVKFILEVKRIDPNHIDEKGDTPIFLASAKGYKKVLELLLKHGANLKTEDEYGNTPLLIASKKGHKEIVDMLTPKGIQLPRKTSSIKENVEHKYF